MVERRERTPSKISICFLAVLMLGCGGAEPPPLQKHPARVQGKYEDWPAGLNAEQWDTLIHAESLELHYVDPESGTAAHSLHGHEILGTVDVTKSASVVKIARSVAKAMDRETVRADCFLPRHAIRAKRGMEILDLLICFECDGVHIYSADEKIHRYSSISKDAAAVLDRWLAGKPNKLVK